MEANKVASEGDQDKGSRDDQIDRLSNLPDDILHQIFSSYDTKFLVHTSLVSKRWTSLWTSAPNINFDSASFDNFTSFSNFVLAVLQRHPPDSKIRKLSFCTEKKYETFLTNTVIRYSLSHDVEHLIVKPNNVRREMFQQHIRCDSRFFLPETVGLSNLTTLHLEGFEISRDDHGLNGFFDFLASCPNLINLCLIKVWFFVFFGGLRISGPKLVNLTMGHVSCSNLEISAPKLVNLTIEDVSCNNLGICAPKVVSFSFKKWEHVKSFSKLNLPSLQAVEVENSTSRWNTEKQELCYGNLFKLLQGLHNAQTVTLHALITRVLSHSADNLVHQPSPFSTRLKTLRFKIDPQHHYPWVPNKVKNYLLGGSPSAEVVVST